MATIWVKLNGEEVTTITLESGKEFHSMFGAPPAKFSQTNHLASTAIQVQQVQNGRWKVLQEGLEY